MSLGQPLGLSGGIIELGISIGEGVVDDFVVISGGAVKARG